MTKDQLKFILETLNLVTYYRKDIRKKKRGIKQYLVVVIGGKHN